MRAAGHLLLLGSGLAFLARAARRQAHRRALAAGSRRLRSHTAQVGGGAGDGAASAGSSAPAPSGCGRAPGGRTTPSPGRATALSLGARNCGTRWPGSAPDISVNTSMSATTSANVGRSPGSVAQHLETSSANAGGISAGIVGRLSSLTTCSRTSIAPSPSSLKGTDIAQSSHRQRLKEYTSAASLYVWPRRISGAVHNGVPHTVMSPVFPSRTACHPCVSRAPKQCGNPKFKSKW